MTDTGIKAVAVGGAASGGLAARGAAATAEGCPPRLIGGSKTKPLIRRVPTKPKTKNSASSISAILFQTAKAD